MSEKQAAKELKQAQDEAIRAMRMADQKALDKASNKAVEALAKIANAKK